MKSCADISSGSNSGPGSLLNTVTNTINSLTKAGKFTVDSAKGMGDTKITFPAGSLVVVQNKTITLNIYNQHPTGKTLAANPKNKNPLKPIISLWKYSLITK